MSQLNPLVSIVIPVYNGSNYLAEAINSALAQTYKNCEVVIVNDGSQDHGKTRRIALSYGDKIRYFEKENGGVSTALNLGIREMKGDYFSWLSHDDLYLPQRVELQLKQMRKYPEAKVSFCNTIIFRKHSPQIYGKRFSEGEVRSDCIKGALFCFKRWIYACSLLIHRTCFDVIGGFNEELRMSQDIELAMNLLAEFDAINVKLPLTLRRDHSESGYNSFRHSVLQESSRCIASKVAEKELSYFLPKISDNVSKAKLYSSLGDHVIYDKRLAAHFYKCSKECWPSVKNIALFKLFLGNRVTKYCIRAKLAGLHRFEKHILRKVC